MSPVQSSESTVGLISSFMNTNCRRIGEEKIEGKHLIFIADSFLLLFFFLTTGSSISLLTFSSCSSRFVRCPLNHFPLSQIAPCWNIGLTAVFFFFTSLCFPSGLIYIYARSN